MDQPIKKKRKYWAFKQNMGGPWAALPGNKKEKHGL